MPIRMTFPDREHNPRPARRRSVGRRVSFTVSFVLPEDATREEAIAYIFDAVGSMKGCYRPPCEEFPDGDAMWNLDADTITVRDGNKTYAFKDGDPE